MKKRLSILSGIALYPTPPDLTREEVVARWSNAELYWILKHGIKGTGMMALGPTHSDDAIWGFTAFVRQMPLMSPTNYQALVERYIEENDQ